MKRVFVLPDKEQIVAFGKFMECPMSGDGWGNASSVLNDFLEGRTDQIVIDKGLFDRMESYFVNFASVIRLSICRDAPLAIYHMVPKDKTPSV